MESMELCQQPESSHREVLQEIKFGSNLHRCDRFCTFKHVFGNLFECQGSGKNHVCDQNCTELVYYDCSTKVCRLSRKVFKQDPVDAMHGTRRRRREDSPNVMFEKRVCRE